MNKSEIHKWVVDNSKTLTAEKLNLIIGSLDNSIIIVEHWHYFESRSPTRTFLEDQNDLEEYLKKNVKPGDSLWFWNFSSLCNENNSITNGKVQNSNGEIPLHGSY
jgi:UDP-N-acetylmuramyl pentapeptide synthase